VSGLTNLILLWVNSNEIGNISAVSGLTHLRWLGLGWNRISEVSALVANAGMNSGDIVDLTYNPLSQDALCNEIPTLQGRGVSVTYTGTCGADADGDDLADAYEDYIGTESGNADTDGDRLDDGDEVTVHFTDPLDEDTDGDGMDDGDEIMFGSDPTDPDSLAEVPLLRILGCYVLVLLLFASSLAAVRRFKRRDA